MSTTFISTKMKHGDLRLGNQQSGYCYKQYHTAFHKIYIADKPLVKIRSPDAFVQYYASILSKQSMIGGLTIFAEFCVLQNKQNSSIGYNMKIGLPLLFQKRPIDLKWRAKSLGLVDSDIYENVFNNPDACFLFLETETEVADTT